MTALVYLMSAAAIAILVIIPLVLISHHKPAWLPDRVNKWVRKWFVDGSDNCG